VSLWWDPKDVPHCWLLSSYKVEWWLVSVMLCWRWSCWLADQLWVLMHTQEEVTEVNSRYFLIGLLNKNYYWTVLQYILSFIVLILFVSAFLILCYIVMNCACQYFNKCSYNDDNNSKKQEELEKTGVLSHGLWHLAVKIEWWRWWLVDIKSALLIDTTDHCILVGRAVFCVYFRMTNCGTSLKCGEQTTGSM